MKDLSFKDWLTLGSEFWKSNSKRAGEAAEKFVQYNIPCPRCNDKLNKMNSGVPGYDFQCKSCKEKYQLKAIQAKSIFNLNGVIRSINGAEYNESRRHLGKINFLILVYEDDIKEIWFIEREDITKSNLIPRKPCNLKNRKEKWNGCFWKFDQDSLQSIKWKKIRRKSISVRLSKIPKFVTAGIRLDHFDIDG